MPLRPMLPTVLLASVLSIVVGVLAVARGASVPLGLAVGLFAVQVLLTLWRINAPLGAPVRRKRPQPTGC